MNRALALDVTIDGIKYTLDVSTRTAKVAGSQLSNVVVPEIIESDGISYKVTAIGRSAFRFSGSIRTIKTGNSILTLEEEAFCNAENLEKADFGNSLRTINSFALEDCNKLEYIVIPRSISSIATRGLGDSYDNKQLVVICLREGFNVPQRSNVIYPSTFFSFGNNSSVYNGKVPEVNYTFNGIGFGFQVSEVNQDAMVGTVGNHTVYLHCTFSNDDMSFDANIPYTYTIKPVKLTAKAKDASRLYGDADPQFEAIYSGFVNGEDVSVVTNHGTFTTTATAKSDVGKYAIRQTGAIAQNYVFEYEDGTLEVYKAPLTMTANDKKMIYGDRVPVLDARYEGLKNNEIVPVWTSEPQLTTTATSKSKVAQYPIVIGNAIAKNYDVTCYNGTLTVAKAPLNVKVDDKIRLYGDVNPEFTLTYSGMKNDETVPAWYQQPSFETAATERSNVGSYPVSLKNAVAVNYEITPTDGTLTVSKAPLMVTPRDYTRKYGEENPEFELVYEGLRNSENQPEWTQAPKVTTNANKNSSVGEYAIELKSGETRNYAIEKGNGLLTITKAPLTIKLQDATRKYGMTNPNFTMAYTGLVNDETEPAWTTYPAVSTGAWEKSDVGEYPITAIGGVLKNYEVDDIIPGVLTITPASLVVKAQNASRLYFEENPTLKCDYVGFISGDGPSKFATPPVLTTTATLFSPVGIYPIDVHGATIKNYELSYERGQIEVHKRTLTVSTGKYTRSYGEKNPEFTISYKGFVNDEDESVLKAKPKATTEAEQYTDTGVYDIKIANGVAENYSFTYVNGYLTIEKAYQTLSWEQDFSNTEQYDQVELMAEASSGLTITYSIEGDNIGSITKIGTKQYLDCYGTGEAVIIAQQEGDKNYWQTTKIYKPISINIVTGLNTTNTNEIFETMIFDTLGNRHSKLYRGINIIKMSDGTTKKVLVK